MRAMPRSPYQNSNEPYTRGGSGTTSPARRAGGNGRRRTPPKRGRGGRRRGRSGVAIVAVLLVLLAAVGVFAIVKINQEKQEAERLELLAQEREELLASETYYEGIRVDGVDISGMTRQEAEAALGAQASVDTGNQITLTDGEQSYPLEVVSGNDLAAVLDEAYALGRTGTEEERLAQIESLTLEPVDLPVTEGYSVLDLDAQLQAIKEQVDIPAVDAKVTGFDTSEKEFKVENEVVGREMDTAAVKNAVQAALDNADFATPIALSFQQVEPAYKAADLTEAKLLASFSTTTTSNSNRNTNIRLCSQALSGQVVMPGEEFSINNITGERTPAKGYMDANVIKNGVYVEEPGGGVCQVSSTLFNAVVRAGFTITERHNHTIMSNYVNESEDAAIDYPYKDFKFLNNSDGPAAVVFKFDEENKKLTAYVYGTPILGEGETLDLESKLISETPQPEPTYQEDPTLAYGEELLISEGRAGAKYETYLIHLKDGKEVSRELLHKSTYPAKASVYAINSAAVPGDGNFDVPEEPGAGGDGVMLPEEGAVPTE